MAAPVQRGVRRKEEEVGTSSSALQEAPDDDIITRRSDYGGSPGPSQVPIPAMGGERSEGEMSLSDAEDQRDMDTATLMGAGDTAERRVPPGQPGKSVSLH